MKSSWLPILLILLFSANSLAREFSKKDLDQIFQDSNQGNPKAQAYLGGMYYNGNGVPLDHIKAVKWWRKAAEQSNIFGQLNLGRMYSRGEGVPQDYVEAAKWYRKAAEQGDSNAIDELKTALQRQKYTKTAEGYRNAAEQGDAEMQVKMGNIYQYGRNGVTKDRSEAMKWFRKAADQGNANGAYELGGMFYYGSISTQDHTEATKWYRKSAELGSKEGQYKLGIMYLHGEAVDKDLREAEKWFRKAAGQGSLPAKSRLYEMSDEGKKKIASKEISQTIETSLSLLLFFPIWWLIAGYLFNCSPKRQSTILVIVFAGGIVGFFIAFACGGGAGGSSKMSASAWSCFLPYMTIQNIVLALIIFSGKRKKENM